MDDYQFTNNAKSTLASGIASGALSLDVQAGEGALFPSPTGAEYFLCTLVDTSGNREIIQVTARSTDTFTIVRNQEGSGAKAFSADDKVELRLTAGTLQDIVDDIQTAEADIVALDADFYEDHNATDGKHDLVTLKERGAKPTASANEGYLYSKETATKAELYYEDEDGNEVQLTSAGEILAIPSGEIILFEKDTAVAGYTLQTDKDDYIVYIGKGTGATGLEGGTDRSGGTWTQPDHNHQWYNTKSGQDESYNSGGSVVGITTTSSSDQGILGNTGTDQVLDTDYYTTDTATPNTYRPPGRIFTRQQKD